jgi:hypothetical protein
MKREPTAKEREKIDSAILGCKAGRGGWSGEVLTPSAGARRVIGRLRQGFIGAEPLEGLDHRVRLKA